MIGPDLLLSLPALTVAIGMRSCSPQPPPMIEVVSTERPIETDNSKSIRDITIMAKGAYRPAGAWDHATGLTVAVFRFETRYKIRSLLDPETGTGCYWLDKVTVDLNFAPTVYIAREYPAGSCRYGAVFTHEMKHIAVDRQILGEYLPTVKTRLENATARLGVIGPRPKGTDAEIKRRIASMVEQTVNQVLDKIQAERRQRQQTVDTPEEYRAVHKKCG